MKKLQTLIALLIFSSQAFGQQNVREYNKPFSKIKQEKEAQIRKLVKKYGTSVLTEEGGAYQEYIRWSDFWAPRIAPDSTYASYNKNLRDYYDSHREPFALQPGTNAPGNTDNWYELGPFNTPNNGVSTLGVGVGVGIIQSIAINRQNPSKLLANSLAGGLFFSSDKGLNWANAGSDAWFRSGCSAAAFAPDNETTWYAGSNTGGSYYFSAIGSVGGVYRTTDAGITWSIIADRVTFNPSIPVNGEATTIHKILIDPKHPNVGYLGTGTGLYESTNINTPVASAVTWSLVHIGAIEDIEFTTDTSSTSTVIISYVNNGAWDIAKSNDQGLNWPSLPFQPSHAGTTQIVIEVSDAAPSSLYVLDRKSSAGMWTFNLTNNAWTQNAQGIANEIGAGHCFGVSNFNSMNVYVGYGTYYLAKSTDGGNTFAEPPTVPHSDYHADVEDIVTPFASCASCLHEVYVSTHGGVNYSPDDMTTLQSRSNGLGIAACGGSASQDHPERIVINVDHDGSIISSGAYGYWPLAWETVDWGDGTPPLIDYSDGDYVWVEHQNSVPQLSTTGGNSGSYLSTAFVPPNDNVDPIRQNQVHPEIVYCPSKTHTQNGFYEDLFTSNTRGIGTTSIGRLSDFKTTHSLPAGHFIFGIFPSPNDENVLYLSEDTNTTYLSHLFRNDSMLAAPSFVKTHWTELLFPHPMKYGSAAVDLYNPNIVYFDYSGNGWPSPEFYRTDYTNQTNPVSINFAGTRPPADYQIRW